MRAVGHVAWNRHKQDKSSLIRVITLDAQFTSINPPKKTYDPQLDVWPLPFDNTFTDAMRIANEIIGGMSTDPTHGATFYWNPNTSTSGGWYDRNIANNQMYEKTAIIGAHEFHRKIAATEIAQSVPVEHFGES